MRDRGKHPRQIASTVRWPGKSGHTVAAWPAASRQRNPNRAAVVETIVDRRFARRHLNRKPHHRAIRGTRRVRTE